MQKMPLAGILIALLLYFTGCKATSNHHINKQSEQCTYEGRFEVVHSIYSGRPSPGIWITNPSQIKKLIDSLEGIPRIPCPEWVERNDPFGMYHIVNWGHNLCFPPEAQVMNDTIYITGLEDTEGKKVCYQDIHHIGLWLAKQIPEER